MEAAPVGLRAVPERKSPGTHALPSHELLNGFIGSHVAYGADRLGMFDMLATEAGLACDDIADRSGADPARVNALVRAGELLGYFRTSADGSVELTVAGEDVRRVIGYFTVTVGGFGSVLGNLAPLALGEKQFGVDVLQDDALTAIGCSQNRHFQLPIINRVVDELDVTSVADLGCGDGHRLVHLAGRLPEIRGIGIDKSDDACRLARANIARAGLADRIEIVHADVCSLLAGHDSRLRDIEMVSCFFLIHHFLDDPELKPHIFGDLQQAFPSARRFLIADGFGLPAAEELDELPIFSLAFELFHAFTGVQLHCKKDYDDLFHAAGLQVLVARELGHPYEWLYLLKR